MSHELEDMPFNGEMTFGDKVRGFFSNLKKIIQIAFNKESRASLFAQPGKDFAEFEADVSKKSKKQIASDVFFSLFVLTAAAVSVVAILAFLGALTLNPIALPIVAGVAALGWSMFCASRVLKFWDVSSHGGRAAMVAATVLGTAAAAAVALCTSPALLALLITKLSFGGVTSAAVGGIVSQVMTWLPFASVVTGAVAFFTGESAVQATKIEKSEHGHVPTAVHVDMDHDGGAPAGLVRSSQADTYPAPAAAAPAAAPAAGI